MFLNNSELLQTSISATSSAPTKRVRLTGSLRRESSAACASARRFRRIGISSLGSEGGKSGAQGAGQWGTHVLQFGRLIGRQFVLQKSGRMPDLAFKHQFRLQRLNHHRRASRPAANEDLGDSLVLLVFKKV